MLWMGIVGVMVGKLNAFCPERKPERVFSVTFIWWASIFRHCSFTGPKLDEIYLCFNKAIAIWATTLERVVKLKNVVFPEANGAN
jgi:hypothetical protein